MSLQYLEDQQVAVFDWAIVVATLNYQRSTSVSSTNFGNSE